MENTANALVPRSQAGRTAAHRGTPLCCPGAGRSIVENNAQKRLIDVDVALGVVDEAQVPEFVHEEINPRARRPNHLR